MVERRTRPRVAEVIDGVDWDYDPENDPVSPLLSTRRYFRDFPWEADAAPPSREKGPDRA